MIVKLGDQAGAARRRIGFGQNVRQIERERQRLIEAIRLVNPPDAAEPLAGALVRGDGRQQRRLANPRLAADAHRMPGEERTQHAGEFAGAPFKNSRAGRGREPGARCLDHLRGGMWIPARRQGGKRHFRAGFGPGEAERSRVELSLILLDREGEQRLGQRQELFRAKAE